MNDAPLTINQTVHFRRVPCSQHLFGTRLIEDKGVEIVAQHRKVAALADDHMRVEVLVSHDMGVLVELRKVSNHGGTTDEQRLDHRIEIADVFMVVIKVSTAIAGAPPLVERTLQVEKGLGDIVGFGFHLSSFHDGLSMAIIGHGWCESKVNTVHIVVNLGHFHAFRAVDEA